MLKRSKTFSLSHKKYKFLPNSSADKILIIDDFPFFPSGIKAVCSSHLQISEIHVVRMGSKHLTGLKVYRCPARNTPSRIQKHVPPPRHKLQLPNTRYRLRNQKTFKHKIIFSFFCHYCYHFHSIENFHFSWVWVADSSTHWTSSTHKRNLDTLLVHCRIYCMWIVRASRCIPVPLVPVSKISISRVEKSFNKHSFHKARLANV